MAGSGDGDGGEGDCGVAESEGGRVLLVLQDVEEREWWYCTERERERELMGSRVGSVAECRRGGLLMLQGVHGGGEGGNVTKCGVKGLWWFCCRVWRKEVGGVVLQNVEGVGLLCCGK